MFKTIVQKIIQLKKLIQTEEIDHIVEITNDIAEIGQEMSDLIQTTDITSVCNIGSHLFSISAQLIDHETYLIDLKRIIKKILKHIYNTLLNSKIKSMSIVNTHIEDDPTIKIFESILPLIKTIQEKHHLLTPKEIRFKKIEKKLYQLHAISQEIKLLTNKININNIPQFIGYLRLLLSKLSFYKNIIDELIIIVDETALQFNYDDCD